MLSGKLATWLGGLTGDHGRTAVGVLLTDARLSAKLRRRKVVDPTYVFVVLFRVPEVKDALRVRGVEPRDVDAILDQLVDDDELYTDGDDEPTFAPALDGLVAASQSGGAARLAPFLRALAAELPPALGFVRGPLHASAEDVDRALDAPLAHQADGSLTLAGWEPAVKRVIALSQGVADRSEGSYTTRPEHALLAATLSPDFKDLLTRRGLGRAQLEAHFEVVGGRHAARSSRPVRYKPAGERVVTSLSFHTLLVRAERFAGEDRCDVTIGHLLAALREEEDLRELVDGMDL